LLPASVARDRLVVTRLARWAGGRSRRSV